MDDDHLVGLLVDEAHVEVAVAVPMLTHGYFPAISWNTAGRTLD